MLGILNTRKNCRLCGQSDLRRVLQLTPTPPANAFVPENRLGEIQESFPLDVYQCLQCSHVQLLDVLDPRYLFENYVYVSGTSPVFVKHFQNYAETIISDFNISSDSLIIDIGSNDGTLLKFFRRAGMRVLGIDPAVEIAENATRSGIQTLPLFFDPELARRIRKEHGPATVITANNVFAHADDLKAFTEGVAVA